MKALRIPGVVDTLIAIETYNATILDKASNGYARVLAEHLEMPQTGSSDAHILSAI
jgi:predicted metal-dependent phosphoesterase TrpH